MNGNTLGCSQIERTSANWNLVDPPRILTMCTCTWTRDPLAHFWKDPAVLSAEASSYVVVRSYVQHTWMFVLQWPSVPRHHGRINVGSNWPRHKCMDNHLLQRQIQTRVSRVLMNLAWRRIVQSRMISKETLGIFLVKVELSSLTRTGPKAP